MKKCTEVGKNWLCAHSSAGINNCCFCCRFPVESMVSLPNGTVLSRINANDLMDGNSDGFLA